MSYFEGWFDATPVAHDSTAPTITLVSPATFDPVYEIATAQSVVIDVTDVLPGLRTVTILVEGAGWTNRQVVYNNAAYIAPFTSSTTTTISNGTRYTITPTGGWDSGALTIIVEAVDQDGNFTTSTFTWTIAAATAVDNEGNPGYPFRDATWRWRRRLNKQKCSVVSVAIEDNYSDGPGFTLTALALEIARKPGLDRVPWRGGTYTNRSGSGTSSDGT